MTLFKPEENDKTSHIIHKIVECVLFLGGKVVGDYVYSMINEEIKPECLEIYISNYSKLLEMINNILELKFTVSPVFSGTSVPRPSANLLIKLNMNADILMKIKISNNVSEEFCMFEHELLTLSEDGLYVRNYINNPITNLVKVTKLIKNKQLKSIGMESNTNLSHKDLFVKNVELNKALMKKKEKGWNMINPETLSVLQYYLYKQMYGDYNDVCSICVEGFDNDSKVFKTNCNHVFHVRCWMRNINNRNQNSPGSCPNCRGQVWGNIINNENNISNWPDIDDLILDARDNNEVD
tara:strand:- start:2127 stop:3011 length:885 start_codon:yes stop_codon:yes gene_type:complete